MKPGRAVIMIAAVSAASLAVAPWIGPQALDWQVVLGGGGDGTGGLIFWQLRLPRILLAWLAGGSLAVAGMAFQAMFRNPLATPFTLGVSSGASFGASLAMRAGGGAMLGSLAGLLIPVGAFCGALAAIGMVYGLAGVRRGMPVSTMLLAGVAVNFLFSSLILLIQFTGDFAETIQVLRWTMGSLQVVGMGAPASLAPIALLLVGTLVYTRRDLDLLLAGEDIAATRGVAVRRLKSLLFLSLSLGIACVVAACGPVGFVGLLAPHICRSLVGSRHGRLLPASFLLGGALLVVCDTIARTVMAPAELPVGVFTALLGAPFFLILLLRGEAERRVV